MVASTGRHCVALLFGAAALAVPALASAQEAAGPAQVDSGFALEANIGARFYSLAVLGGGGGTTPGVPTVSLPTVGLTAGYKSGRMLIGLGLEFANSTQSQSQTVAGTMVTTTTSDSSFLIGPDFQFALVRTADNRVELIGDLGLHFGHESVNVSISPGGGGPSPATDSNFLLSYRLAPGVRYWLHSHFAIQAATGFGGQAFFDLPTGKNPMNPNHSEHGIFTNIGMLGVF